MNASQPHEEILATLHPWAKHVLRFASMMIDMPNHLSIHAGGIIISEEPLSNSTALQMMPKGFPVTHFDMYGAEDWGYHKFDVLSQRGLGHIKEAVDLVQKNQNKLVDIHDVERIKHDPKVRAQLKSGRAMGCFYIESPAMRGLLTKLGCEDYVHLVAASSIIRPGVARSGMMRAYIERFHNRNSFEYPHEVFKEHLSETFGVMVYQEDVMKVLHHFAGIGLDEADVMRRMMSGKKRNSEEFERLRQKYFHNCAERGHTDALAQEVWRQIESFAGYSFCKAHSASYAVESFQSLYLKTYYPLEFMVAVINNFGGFYKTEYYIHEARMCGGNIHAPCVNHSRYLTSIIEKDIYLGFIHLSGLEQQLAQEIVRQRDAYGPYKSLEDFVRRVQVASKQLDILIRIGAFRFTSMQKGQLFWEKNRVFSPTANKTTHSTPVSLFADLDAVETLLIASLPDGLEEGQYDQTFDELELLGFFLRSPFEMVETRFIASHIPPDATRFIASHIPPDATRFIASRTPGQTPDASQFIASHIPPVATQFIASHTQGQTPDATQFIASHTQGQTRDATRDATRDVTRDATRDVTRDATRDVTRDAINRVSTGTTTMYGYYVCRKDTRTIKGETMQFGTWIDCTGAFFDTVHFPDTLRAYPLRGRGVYKLVGKMSDDFGFKTLEVSYLEKLGWRGDERYG
jgi:DNA polymerase III alpha subunit